MLLLDEPFAGADISGIDGISQSIDVLRKRGRAVLLVAKLVDRILLLE